MSGDLGAAPHESRLVAQARDGDRAAFAVLVRDAAPFLERFAIRLLGHRQDAEDALQDTILDAWRGLSRFRGDARFRTWACRILLARASQVQRLQRPRGDLDDALEASVAGPSASPADGAASRELEEAIRRAIDALPPVQRATLLLRADHGMSYVEIAYVLGSTRDAVRMNLIDARRNLAQRLRGVADLGGPMEDAS